MRQNINLYQPIFRKQEKVFSAKTMLQGAALVLAGLTLFYAYALYQTRSLEGQLARFEQQRQQSLQQLEQISRLHPPREKSAALEEAVDQARREYQATQQVVARLADRRQGNNAGFSAHLEGLARQRLEQTWLRQIHLEQGGEAVVLIGSTYQPEQVPQYLQRLAAEPSYQGKTFSTFSLQRAEKAPRRMDFEVRTLPAEGDRP